MSKRKARILATLVIVAAFGLTAFGVYSRACGEGPVSYGIGYVPTH